ncbi:hypothetical protein [Desulfobacter hydrogenophilus]|uniref:hypothetical protein n=1 Tax=Desulfobacter hydrogenophilus TaxID=2291 RepID=UPI001A9522A8|nr:hypothetical protein [Desulfobacter hydrogenophilus]
MVQQVSLGSTKIENQQILTKAFRGGLVPQDPTDEPALVLLDRIKAEREAMKPKKKTKNKGFNDKQSAIQNRRSAQTGKSW